jgi:hypothetical protein
MRLSVYMCHLLYQERQQSGETKEASAKYGSPRGNRNYDAVTDSLALRRQSFHIRNLMR